MLLTDDTIYKAFHVSHMPAAAAAPAISGYVIVTLPPLVLARALSFTAC